MRSPKILTPAGQLFWLSRNRPHVFSDHLEITGLEAAKVSANNEHVARVSKREVRLVLETHGEIERPVFDGMGDKVHDLAMNFRVSPPKTVVLLLDSPLQPPVFCRADRLYWNTVHHHGLGFFLLRHARPPALCSRHSKRVAA